MARCKNSSGLKFAIVWLAPEGSPRRPASFGQIGKVLKVLAQDRQSEDRAVARFNLSNMGADNGWSRRREGNFPTFGDDPHRNSHR